MRKLVGTRKWYKFPMDTIVCSDTVCPVDTLMRVLGGKWCIPVLYTLHTAEGPVRFMELQRRVGRVTQKELTKTLRHFEELGMVRRTIYPEVPPRVEYVATDLGRSVQKPLRAMAEWGLAHRAEFDGVLA